MENKQAWADAVVTILARDHTHPFCYAIRTREDKERYVPSPCSFNFLSWLVGDRVALAWDTDESARDFADAIAKEQAFDYDRRPRG